MILKKLWKDIGELNYVECIKIGAILGIVIWLIWLFIWLVISICYKVI